MAKKKQADRAESGRAHHPSMSVLCKLGSIVVHCDELYSKGGHHFDKIALEQLVQDPEIREWIDAMNKLGLIPVKRN